MDKELIVFDTLAEVKDHLLQTRLDFIKFCVGGLFDDLYGARSKF